MTKLALWLVDRYGVITPGEKRAISSANDAESDLQEANRQKAVLSVRLIEESFKLDISAERNVQLQQELDVLRSSCGDEKEQILKREREALKNSVALAQELGDAQERIEVLAGNLHAVSGRLSSVLEEKKHLEANSIPLPASTKELIPSALEVALQVEHSSRPGTSGEYKHHAALDRMMNRHPSVNIRDIWLALVLAVRENL